MRTLLLLAVALPAMALAQPAAHWEPQAFLAGGCWKGTFPDGKQEQTYRSSWRREGNDAYFVITEVKAPDGWKEAWRVRMQRQK
jgi:hypothetical protein